MNIKKETLKLKKSIKKNFGLIFLKKKNFFGEKKVEFKIQISLFNKKEH